MSKETKIAKKEAKAAKKAAKLEVKQAKQYDKLVQSINKKNAKAEKKANKKGKPFVPAPIPTQEEAFATVNESNGKKVFKLIILILLIWFVIYFLVMWFTYVAPTKSIVAEEDTPSAATEYDRYENPHEITQTKTFTKSECSLLLKQAIHDNWKTLGYTADPSSSSINAEGGVITVNNVDCYVYSASGKKFAVATNQSAIYVIKDGKYDPITFHNTDIINP